MTVDGEAKTIDEVLADPRLAPLVSNEGVMLQSRYDVAPFIQDLADRPAAVRTGVGRPARS